MEPTTAISNGGYFSYQLQCQCYEQFFMCLCAGPVFEQDEVH